ncbi:hypothetical protein JZ751_026054 [Albula glossodonta]|uniref:Uncharacterized protein n=1 Tax=Albula glossodonta TaxID=121402 RepID=A0A8T2ND91_9TELE|nr:hypothetical protein JZ751_026054 [Albula glossodonta]
MESNFASFVVKKVCCTNTCKRAPASEALVREREQRRQPHCSGIELRQPQRTDQSFQRQANSLFYCTAVRLEKPLA